MTDSLAITWSAARNPKWGDSAQTWIDVEVNFDDLEEEFVGCGVRASGDEPHIHDLYARCIAGEFGPIATYTAPDEVSGIEAAQALREKRNELLAETDYWALSDTTTMTAEQSAYRQALRDLPANNPYAAVRWVENEGHTNWVNVAWPTKP